jgi:hypothetical protein
LVPHLRQLLGEDLEEVGILLVEHLLPEVELLLRVLREVRKRELPKQQVELEPAALLAPVDERAAPPVLAAAGARGFRPDVGPLLAVAVNGYAVAPTSAPFGSSLSV